MESRNSIANPLVSVIIPVGTETDISFYKQIFSSLANEAGLKEVLWVSSNEALNEWLKTKKGRLIKSTPKGSRGLKMHHGFEQASGSICLFHHPRSILSAGWYKELSEAYRLAPDPDLFWGGFTHQFLGPLSSGLKFTSWYSNQIRGDRQKILYLDHCMFSSRKLLKDSGGVPDQPVFEDTLLSKRLKGNGSYIRLKTIAPTSSVRFEKNGFCLQVAINLLSKAMFALGVSPKVIYRIYEFRNWLN